MRRALLERPVSGTTVSANRIDHSSMILKVKNIEGISTYHNIEFEDTGLRAWKAFGIGEGRLFPFKDILINSQVSTNIQQEGFFKKENRPVKPARPDERRDTKDGLFECSVVGCGKVFRRFEDLEFHLDVGKHGPTVHNACKNSMRWALSKSRAGTMRFSQNMRYYLTERFDLGEITGMKSNPPDVENDMRSARNEKNEKRFSRDEWLTAPQIKSFFLYYQLPGRSMVMKRRRS